MPFPSPRRPDPKSPLHVASPSHAQAQTAPVKPQTWLPPGTGAETASSAQLEFTAQLCTVFEEILTTHIHQGSFSLLAQTREIATSFTNTAAPRCALSSCPGLPWPPEPPCRNLSMQWRIPRRYSYPGCPVQPCLAATQDTGVLPTGDSPLNVRVRPAGQGEAVDEGRDAGRAVGLG